MHIYALLQYCIGTDRLPSETRGAEQGRIRGSSAMSVTQELGMQLLMLSFAWQSLLSAFPLAFHHCQNVSETSIYLCFKTGQNNWENKYLKGLAKLLNDNLFDKLTYKMRMILIAHVDSAIIFFLCFHHLYPLYPLQILPYPSPFKPMIFSLIIIASIIIAHIKTYM